MKILLTVLGLCAAVGGARGQQIEMPAKLQRSTSAAAGPTLPTYRVNKSRISSDLQQLYRYAASPAAATAGSKGLATPATLRAAFPQLVVPSKSGSSSVLVRITAQDVAALRPALQARGFVTVAEKASLHFIEGELPVSQLAPGAAGIEALAAQGLLGVRAVWKPMTNVGRVQNQADYALESYRVRGAQAGYSGKNQRVGVMSDSYNSRGGAPAGVASGDLPANVQVLQDLTAAEGGSDEGRAMLELVHDIAPDAGLAFSSVFNGEANFADQLLKLADPTLGNCKVVVDDIFYYFEPMFQDGVIAQAVNEATNRLGISYFSSAGNNADASCEYAAPVFKPLTAATNGDADLDFGASFSAGGASDTRQHFSIPKGYSVTLVLQWSDPFYTRDGVKTDLDMFLVKTRANGIVLRGDTVAASGDNNIANQTPVEGIQYLNNNDTDTEFDLVISRYQGTANPTRVKYVSYGNGLYVVPSEYFTHSNTLLGHTAAAGAMSVAAAPSYNRLSPEGFTSKGRPTILFNADGTPLASPEVRLKPDFTAVDGVSTTFFSGGAVPDPKDGYLFFGTSAAAPNAAGVAALLLQAQPTLTPALVKARLISTALDINTAGFDDLTGAGLINAYRAIYGPVVAATTPFVETFDAAGLSTAWDIQGRGPARAIVRSDYGPASTPGHLVLDAFFPYYSFSDYTAARVSEATLSLNLSTAAAGGYVLSFRHKKFTGEVDNAMPLTFPNNGTGSASDGVAMSVDGGTTWYRVASLTGTSATTDYQQVSVNLTTLAAANNLTLGSDVRIRFQRSGSGQVDSYTATLRGGRAFDDITVTGANATSAPVAQFNVTATAPICPGSSVQFRDASLFAPTSYAWSFPGGTPATSTDANPTVTYAAAGTYNATLTVTNAAGTSSRTLTGVVVVSSAAPVASFTNRQTPICPGGQVVFTNTSTQCVSSISWAFPGGSPATSTAQSPVVTYAAAGTYTATLTATNANGSSTKTFTVQVQGAATAIPYTETLASGIPTTWSVINPDNAITWASTSNILRKDGTRGAVADMNFYDYAARGQRDTLQTVAFDLRNQPRAFLRFDVAYAPVALIPSANNDSLAVDVYTACTNTRLGRVYIKSALTGLGTTLFRDAVYTPSSVNQWRTENIDLASYLNQQIYLRFVAFNQNGNHLYLSNVQVANTVLAAKEAIAESSSLQAYPNPVAGGQSLSLTLPTVAGPAALRVVDAVGRSVWQGHLVLQASTPTHHTITAPLTAGLYTVLCQTADGQFYSRRVAVE
jgi:PKD repeat protein